MPTPKLMHTVFQINALAKILEAQQSHNLAFEVHEIVHLGQEGAEAQTFYHLASEHAVATLPECECLTLFAVNGGPAHLGYMAIAHDGGGVIIRTYYIA